MDERACFRGASAGNTNSVIKQSGFGLAALVRDEKKPPASPDGGSPDDGAWENDLTDEALPDPAEREPAEHDLELDP